MNTLSKRKTKTLEKVSIIFGYVIESFFLPSFAFFMFPLLPVFFPDFDPKTTSYLILLLFGVGYLARPVGALIFGHIADAYGGRLSLILSLSLAVVSTISISLLPCNGTTLIYSQIGLFVLRFLQGVGCGNNTASLAVYYHNNYSYKPGFISGITFSLGLVGFILAKILSMSGNLNLTTSWRAPFFISGILGVIAILLRYFYLEKIKLKATSSKIGLLSFFRDHKKSFFFTVFTAGMFVMPLYVCVFRLNGLAPIFSLEHYKFINVVTILMIKLCFFLLVGYSYEKINFEKMKPIILGIHVLVPLTFLVKSALYNPVYVYLVQIVFLVSNVFLVLYYFRKIPGIFPKSLRYRAVGLGFATGYATLGGFCLLFFEYLDHLSVWYNFSSLFIAGVALLLFLMDRKQNIA